MVAGAAQPRWALSTSAPNSLAKCQANQKTRLSSRCCLRPSYQRQADKTAARGCVIIVEAVTNHRAQPLDPCLCSPTSATLHSGSSQCVALGPLALRGVMGRTRGGTKGGSRGGANGGTTRNPLHESRGKLCKHIGSRCFPPTGTPHCPGPPMAQTVHWRWCIVAAARNMSRPQ